MKNKKNIILSIALIIVIAFSFVIFYGVGDSPKTEIQTISFVFIIITELVVFANSLLITNKKMNMFAIAGLSTTTFLYAVVSIIINILAMGLFTTIKSIIVFNISIILIYLFIDTMIILFKKEN